MGESPENGMEQRLQEGKVVQLTPQGISMLPFIRGGEDHVLVRKEDKLEVGDIVLVKYGEKYILHRIYAINGTSLVLMGDGNLQGTEHVEASEVLGTVVEVISPNGRCRKPGKAWLWRHSLPLRRYLLKLHRKWNNLRASSRVSRPEVPRQ